MNEIVCSMFFSKKIREITTFILIFSDSFFFVEFIAKKYILSFKRNYKKIKEIIIIYINK